MIPAERGDILDARGRVLATNVPADRVSAVVAQIADPRRTARLLAPIVDPDERDILAALTQPGKEWVVLQRQLSDQASWQIRSLGLPGLVLTPELRRVYPMGDFASQVLGFVNDAYVGSYGVEGAYDRVVGGTPGKLVAQRDTSGNVIALANSVLEPPKDGSDLLLTIDSAAQRIVEDALDQAIAQHAAPSGSTIVQDPKTGAILAMASRPSFDPNQFARVTDTAVFANPAIAAVYEPGSTFKMLIMALGLDTGTVTPDTVHDGGSYRVIPGGARVYNALHAAFGPETMTQILGHSSNLGAMWVAEQVGKNRLYPGLQAFGLGRPTGIDLPGEADGILPLPGSSSWTAANLYTNAFGQGLAVTPLQLVTAASAVANGGELMKPRVVQQIRDADGIRSAAARTIRRVLSPETSRRLTGMLVAAVDGSSAYQQYVAVPGYDIAAKTGTAQVPASGGGYDPTATIASVLGFGPASDPRFTVLVKIDRPADTPWGESAAGPAFRAILQQLMLLQAVPPDHPVPASTSKP